MTALLDNNTYINIGIATTQKIAIKDYWHQFECGTWKGMLGYREGDDHIDCHIDDLGLKQKASLISLGTRHPRGFHDQSNPAR